MEPERRLESIAEALSIPRVERHIFLCADQSNPRCAPTEVTNVLWKHLKKRLKDLDLTSAPAPWRFCCAWPCESTRRPESPRAVGAAALPAALVDVEALVFGPKTFVAEVPLSCEEGCIAGLLEGFCGTLFFVVADHNVASLLAFRDHPHRRAGR